MNLGDEYQNFLIFIALITASDEGWATKLQYFPPILSPPMNVGDGAHRRCGNQALISNLVFELNTLLNMLYELVHKILNGFFLK